MNINFGPKLPTREVRIKVGQQLLRIASGKIQDAAWETVQDSEVRGFDISDLDCISYDSELSIFEGDTICYTLWKQPKKCKYLVMWENIHDFGAFLLQGGSNTSLMTKTGLIACLAKSCYIVFKKAKRLSTNTADEIFCTAPEKIFPQSVEATLQTVQDVLKLKSYTSGPNCDRVCVVALEGFGFVEEGTSAQMYPALEEKAGQMPGDFEIGLTRKGFNSTILGGNANIQQPSQVPLIHAYNVLRRQEDRKWKLLPEDPIPAADVCLQSLHVDVDSGIFYVSAAPLALKDVRFVLQSIKAILPVEMLDRCTTTYVPRGKQWRLCQKAVYKPTIFQRGEYVRLPHPDHTNEAIKIWLHLPASTLLPAKFLDTIRTTFNKVARTIVESETCHLKEKILLSNLEMDSSSLSASIPGGVLLALAAFAEVSKIHPQVELVLETYNGKLKGLSASVQICDGIPQMLQPSASLIHSCTRTENLFFIVSRLIRENLFTLVAGSSSIGFGFRASFNKQKEDKGLVLASLKFRAPDKTNIQLFPLAYLDKDICPNVTSWNETTKVARAKDVCNICRSQFYLEQFSLQKTSNTQSQWAYASTGQNLKEAMSMCQSHDCAKCRINNCASLNASVLKNGLPSTCAKLDQSFKLLSEIGGSRFEIAVHPTLFSSAEENASNRFVFDFQKSIESCWEHVVSNVRFDDNRSIVTFGVLNTAACLLGYRAALDELSVSTPGSDSQQELFCFVRYMNAILNSICNGTFVDGQNPKLFLSKWGLTAGRPLAIIPTIPLIVLERIRLWDSSCPIPTVEAPFKLSPTEHHKQNRIEIRIAENTSQREMENCMICWTCKELFYGNFETRKRLLKDHLTAVNHWAHSKTAVSIVDGQMWRNDFEKKRKAFELKLLQGNDDQHWAYKFAMTWTSLCMIDFTLNRNLYFPRISLLASLAALQIY